MRYSSRKNRRVAVSETIGAMLAIAMTLIAGAAAWSFVRSQSAVSELALQNGVVGTNNYLAEHFNVIDQYYSAATSTTFWVYNTGALTYQAYSVRFFGPSGTINLLYNYTTNAQGVKTDYVYDLSSSLATKCKTAASAYEVPTVSGTDVKSSDAQIYTLTIPGTVTNCPSFGYSLVSGTTYSVVVTGLYGNVVTHSATR